MHRAEQPLEMGSREIPRVAHRVSAADLFAGGTSRLRVTASITIDIGPSLWCFTRFMFHPRCDLSP
jgi:hypothetical protein